MNLNTIHKKGLSVFRNMELASYLIIIGLKNLFLLHQILVQNYSDELEIKEGVQRTIDVLQGHLLITTFV